MLVVVLVALSVLVTFDSTAGAHDTFIDTLLAPFAVLAVTLRHRRPELAAWAWTAGIVLSAVPTFSQPRCGPGLVAALLILFALGSRAPLRTSATGLLVVLAGTLFLGYTDSSVGEDGDGVLFFVFAGPLLASAWFGGRVIGARDAAAAALAERSRILALQRERTARLAVEVERNQLSTHLDDAARGRLQDMTALASRGLDAPASRPAVFAEIESSGRATLNDMRSLLGVLRSDERGATLPRPTLAQLDAMLDDARRGGRVVDLRIAGDRRPLPESVELAAYRTLEHALATVRGGADPAEIIIRYLPHVLELEVSGVAADGATAEGAVAAARERVTASGGEFDDLPAGGRRTLRCRLPEALVAA